MSILSSVKGSHGSGLVRFDMASVEMVVYAWRIV